MGERRSPRLIGQAQSDVTHRVSSGNERIPAGGRLLFELFLIRPFIFVWCGRLQVSSPFWSVTFLDILLVFFVFSLLLVFCCQRSEEKPSELFRSFGFA